MIHQVAQVYFPSIFPFVNSHNDLLDKSSYVFTNKLTICQFCHFNNNRPANHVAVFVSRAQQFLVRDRAVLYHVPEYGTRKFWYQIDLHTCKFLAPDDWYQFLVPVSVTCIAGFSQGLRSPNFSEDFPKIFS